MSKQLSLTESNLELVASFNDAIFGDHDLDRLEEFVAPDVVQIEGEETTAEGIDAVRSYFAELFETFGDPELEVLETVGDAEHVMYHFRMNGTPTGDIELGGKTIDAAGTPLHWDGFVCLTIEDDRITRACLLTDQAGIYRQLGVLPDVAA